MPQIDTLQIKSGTVFPNYPKAADVGQGHVFNVEPDGLYALELEDKDAPVTRGREYRIYINPFGQRTLIKGEFLYDNSKQEVIGEKYRFVPAKAVREIDVTVLDSVKWQHAKKGKYGSDHIGGYLLRIIGVIAFLWVCVVLFNRFMDSEAGARFLFKQMMDSYSHMECEEIQPSEDVASFLLSQMMNQEYFVIYDFANDVVVQKYGNVMLFDMGKQDRYIHYLDFSSAEIIPEEVLKYMPDRYIKSDPYLRQLVIRQDRGDVYILQGRSTILYYHEGVFISSPDGMVKIVFQEMDPIFVYGK